MKIKNQLFTQGALILLPLLVLSLIGIRALVLSKREIQADARVEAREIGRDLQMRIQAELAAPDRLDLRTDRLDFEVPPSPPEDTGPGRAFNEAMSDYEAHGDPGKLKQQFEKLRTLHPDAETVTGLPLSPLLLYHEARVSEDVKARAEIMEELRVAVLSESPSMLTPLVLDFLEDEGVLRAPDRAHWTLVESLRALRTNLPETMDVDGTSWHLFRIRPGQIRAIPQATLDRLVREAQPVGRSAYLSPGLSRASEELALAEFGGSIPVTVWFSHPERLFRQQRIFTRLFALLIGVAFVTALAGFLSLRKTVLKEARLNELKGNFVASVSHELRTPIASMKLLIDRLSAGQVNDAEKQAEYYGLLSQESSRLKVLVENVLDYARIDQQRKRYTFEPVDIKALMEAALALLQQTARDRGIELKLDIEAFARDPEVDPVAIQQVVVNLVDNAIKHSPSPGEVDVTAREIEAGRFFEIQVTDRGSGIPPDSLPYIFDRFYRGGTELTRETQGVGIGLSIVKHIVDGHGGTVEVESGNEQGSTFVVKLPVTQEEP